MNTKQHQSKNKCKLQPQTFTKTSFAPISRMFQDSYHHVMQKVFTVSFQNMFTVLKTKGPQTVHTERNMVFSIYSISVQYIKTIYMFFEVFKRLRRIQTALFYSWHHFHAVNDTAELILCFLISYKLCSGCVSDHCLKATR